MKLRNKKTGKIIDSKELLTDEFIIDLFSKDFNYFNSKINKIQDEWEDYEEPKEYFYIYANQVLKGECDGIMEDRFKEVGNYFNTKEEAEKAVEKLKAWKRLKDKGFSIYSWDYEFDMVDKPAQTIILRASAVDSSNEDLDLLFGGKE